MTLSLTNLLTQSMQTLSDPHARIYIGVITPLIDKDTNINLEWRSNQFVENAFAKASLDTVGIPGMPCFGKACQRPFDFNLVLSV